MIAPLRVFVPCRPTKGDIPSFTSDELPARARQRVCDACNRVSIDSAPILKQFDRWRYSEGDMRELMCWPDIMVEAHVRLLASEVSA